MLQNKRKYIFYAAFIGMFVFGIVMTTLGATIPEIAAKFNLSELESGTILSLLPFGILIGSLIFGPVVDRYGYKFVLILGGILTIVGLEGIAFSIDFLWLKYAVLIIGIGGGMLNGTTNAVVSDISSKDRSSNLSFLGVFFGVGALLTPVIMMFLKNLYTYEFILKWLGVTILFSVIFFTSIKFPKPLLKTGFPLAKGFSLLKDRLLIIFGVILFFQSALEGVVNNWTTTFLQDSKSLTSKDALLALSLFVIGLTLARLVLGILLKLFQPFKVLLSSVLIVFVGLLLLNFSHTPIIAFMALALIGIGLAAGFPVVLGFVGGHYKELSGTVFSIVITIALIGNFTCNYLMGIIGNSLGMGSFSAFLILLLLMMTVVLVLNRARITKY